jgi:hypothetical protein
MGDNNRQHVYLCLYTYRLGGVAVLRLHGFFTSCSIIIAGNDGHIVILLDAHVSMPSTAVHSPCLTWSLPQPLTLEEYWRKIHIVLRRRQLDWNHLPCRWAWLPISCLIDCRSRYSLHDGIETHLWQMQSLATEIQPASSSGLGAGEPVSSGTDVKVVSLIYHRDSIQT